MRGVQLVRQWKILRKLESRKRGFTAAELSVELEVPARTIYRDLMILLHARFPIYTEREGRNSYWRLVEGFKSGLPLPFTTTELMALHMSRDVLKVFEGTVFQEGIESLFEKVKTYLSPETIRYLERMSQGVTVGFGPTKDHDSVKEIISRVSEATGTRKRVEVIYVAASTGKETTRKIDPYQVWMMNGGFYLIGLCHLRNSVRTFAVERIRDLTVLDELFRFPEHFSLDEYLQTAFSVMRGDPEAVQVRFSPGAARVVRERTWHPTQDMQEQEDGSLIVTLEVPINYEVISWIPGFGSAAEVLRPVSLRNTIPEEQEASARQYRFGDSMPGKNIATQKKVSAPLT